MSVTLSHQRHLSTPDMINLGSYYTQPHLVEFVYRLINQHVDHISAYTILDSACGYGAFFDHPSIKQNRKIGADTDAMASMRAKNHIQDLEIITHNSLMCWSRNDYRVQANEKLIIVGNPPYNDTTSIIRNQIKAEAKQAVHPELKARDLGVSFLRAYAKLHADFICVLHPLSYLIKKTNFDALGEFAKQYQLRDALVVSSAEFNGTAPSKTYFPIVIALYEKNQLGLTYQDIENFWFTTQEGKKFSISKLTSIANFIAKYPNQKLLSPQESVAKFWTMRDINALRRNRTFIDAIGDNTILIKREQLAYYCYVDIFKRFIERIPYYFGNCDVFIDDDRFSKIKDCFIALSANTRPELQRFADDKIKHPEARVESYFKTLLGEHYVPFILNS